MKYVEVNLRVGGVVGTQIGRRLDGWMNDSLYELFVESLCERYLKRFSESLVERQSESVGDSLDLRLAQRLVRGWVRN